MTYEKAHTWLENRQRMMTQNRYAFQSIDIEANGKAIEALEKQIPKKPTEQGKSPDDENYKFGGCPTCTATVFGDMNFCDNCGQSLDWSEEQWSARLKNGTTRAVNMISARCVLTRTRTKRKRGRRNETYIQWY